ncbi:unnamed protein product [Protopolystoma xenopodis]|uniref:Uncharacterized protein n=1 Tax=Protopolystoma xenopodis TaxID=117903 RepID=A0A3S5CPE9_9PLAT|nr:unnamed protein product [Protopolystoma xenopodis]
MQVSSKHCIAGEQNEPLPRNIPVSFCSHAEDELTKPLSWHVLGLGDHNINMAHQISAISGTNLLTDIKRIITTKVQVTHALGSWHCWLAVEIAYVSIVHDETQLAY